MLHFQLPIWFGLFSLAITLVIFGMLSSTDWQLHTALFLGLLCMMKIGTCVLDFRVKHRAPQAHEGSRIFRMLSYPDPDNTDLSHVRLDPIDPESSWRTVYRYQAALAQPDKPAAAPSKKRRNKRR